MSPSPDTRTRTERAVIDLLDRQAASITIPPNHFDDAPMVVRTVEADRGPARGRVVVGALIAAALVFVVGGTVMRGRSSRLEVERREHSPSVAPTTNALSSCHDAGRYGVAVAVEFDSHQMTVDSVQHAAALVDPLRPAGCVSVPDSRRYRFVWSSSAPSVVTVSPPETSCAPHEQTFCDVEARVTVSAHERGSATLRVEAFLESSKSNGEARAVASAEVGISVR